MNNYNNAKELMLKIIRDYGVESYVKISNDRYLKNISHVLNELWYSDERMSISNIDIYYQRIYDYSYPHYSLREFNEDATKLKDDLTREFAFIIKKSTERRTKI